jgi:glycosyltransferase involved in cell wall biosynthesis
MSSGTSKCESDPGVRAVTVLSSFPPTTAITPYSCHLVAALVRVVDVRALGFKYIYPECLYPGRSTDPTNRSVVPNEAELVQRITWYNPFSWIMAGFRVRGSVLHAQWWSYVLAPIYVTILAIARLRGKRVVVTVHNVLPHEHGWIKAVFNSVVMHLAHALIVHTEANRKQLERTSLGRKPIRVVPMGVIELPSQGVSRTEARQRLGIEENRRVLLFFGGIRRYKGLGIALDALARLVRDEPRYLLLVAGPPWEPWGPYEARIKTLNLKTHVMARTEFIPDEELEAYFRSADLALLPYLHFDAQSAVGATAYGFEVPMLVSDLPGLLELAPHPACVARAGDSEDLAGKVRLFFEQELGREVRCRLEDRRAALSWDRIAEETIAVYRGAWSDGGAESSRACS